MELTGWAWITILTSLLISTGVIVEIFHYILECDKENFKSIKCILLVLSLIVAITPTILIIHKTSNFDTKMVHNYSFKIYNLEDNTITKGNRYYFEEDFKYFYMTDYKDGKKMYSVSKKSAYIVEKEIVEPCIEVYSEKIINKPWYFKIFYGDSEYMIGKNEYKIIVPKKTINKEFNIDMKN